MCGIVGMMSNDGLNGWKQRRDWMSQAVLADSLRGMDSTGMFVVKGDRRVAFYKKALPGWDFLQLTVANRLLADVDKCKFVVAHNRAATRGGVSSNNAHPFHHGHIIGVHNGTIVNHRSLPGCDKFDVDSEAIIFSMAENGEKETLAAIDGAFTLVWYNQEEGCLKIARNEQRPLALATVKDSSTVLFASEAPLIKWLAARNGMELKGIYEPKVGTILSFEENYTKPKSEKVALYEKKVLPVPAAREWYSYNSGYERKQLEILGYTVGQKVTFVVDKSEPYSPKATHGRIEGTSVTDPFDYVTVHSVLAGRLAAFPEGATVEGEVRSCAHTYRNKHNSVSTPVLSIDAGSIKLVAPHQPEVVTDCIYCGCNVKDPDKAPQMTVGAYKGPLCEACASPFLDEKEEHKSC